MAEETAATPQEKLKKNAKQAWTLNRCQKAARRFANEADWKAGAPSSYKAATAKGWVADCKGHLSGGGAKKAAKPAKSA